MSGTPGTEGTGNGTSTAHSPLQPIFIRAEQAAQMLTVTRRHIYELIDSGDIVSVKYGRRRLIDVASLYAFRDRLLSQARS